MWDFFEKHTEGIIGTTIFHVVIAIIVLFLGFSTPLPLPDEEGILITFGTDDDGLGFTQTARQEASTPPPPAPSSETQDDHIITQDIEEAPSLPSREREEVPQPERERPPQERPPDTTTETQQEEVAEEVAERMPNPNALFPGRTSRGDTGTSEGETAGTGNQGRETGSVESPHRTGGDTGSPEGISFSLAGRSSLSLPRPDYSHQVAGIVVVEVTVNRNGDVTNAIPGVRGSTTMNENLLNAARRAAERARFNVRPDAPNFQRGTITYHFRLE